jgi:hypothetical protein
MVKLSYKFQGKGKNRKRELSEILKIIENKTYISIKQNKI